MYPTRAKPGSGIFVKRMDEALQAAGHSVRVVVVSAGHGRSDYLVARPRVVRAARELKPYVIHVHYGYSILATTSEWPRVTTFYGDDLNGESLGDGRFSVKSRIGKRVSWYAARASERTIAVSERLRDRIPNAEARERCTVIPDAVDTRLFAPRDRAAARAELGIADDASLAIFPHDVRVPTKRIDLAIAAFERLKDHPRNVRLWVVNERAPDDMPLYYAAADLLIVTSDTEGGPSSVKEALACGLPVVSVDVGDTATLSRVGRSACVVDRTPIAIAAGVLQALSEVAGPRKSLLPPDLTLPRAAAMVTDVYSAAIEGYRRSRSSQ
jgi:glycosyltransferase involved in cell wall biosynthesis